jgi:hypothetical protein
MFFHIIVMPESCALMLLGDNTKNGKKDTGTAKGTTGGTKKS